MLVLFASLFLFSGAAGLIYEVVWERLLAVYFGVTMTSVTLIVSAYMAGMGLGSLFGGRIARSLKSALLTYGLLEIGIGFFGLGSPLLLSLIGRSTAGSPYWLVFFLSFVFLLIPTFLMGMTLPILAQGLIRRVESSGQAIGALYGINTVGAALGSALAAYVLIGALGFDGASAVAVGINMTVAVIALVATRFMRLDSAVVEPHSKVPARSVRWRYTEILVAAGLVGFIGLGFEMLWIRILHIVNKNTSYGFASILFVFLIGLGIGGFIFGRRADRSKDLEKLFWKLEIWAGATASLVLLLFWISVESGTSLPWLADFWSMQQPASPFVQVGGEFVFSRRQAIISLANYFLPILLMVLPASTLLGGGLPVLDRIAITSPDVVGRRVGDVHLANIAGSVLGSLVISFLLLPALGSEGTHRALVLLGFAFPTLYYLKTRARPGIASGILLIGAAGLTFLLPAKGQLYDRLIAVGSGSRAISVETRETVLALTFDAATQAPNWLWIGGDTNSFYPSNGVYEQRGLVCAAASHPRRVLIIGMGGGVAARFFQSLGGIDEIVVVELMHGLDGMLEEHVPYTRPVFADPRVKYIVDDGRRYLYANPDERFDLIFADPLRWYASGHNSLYSVEAVQLYLDHLSEGGVFCPFVDESHALPLTIAKIFPFVDQFGFDAIVASGSEIHYDLAYMDRTREEFLAAAGAELKPGTPSDLEVETILSKYRRPRDQILGDERRTAILSDMRPALEFYFFNRPDRRPVFPKGDALTYFASRLIGCDAIGRPQLCILGQ